MKGHLKSSGTFSKQAHVDIPKGLYEEEHGRDGFFGEVSHLYHENPPVSWTNIEGDLKPRSIENVFDEKEDFTPLLYNDDCIISSGSLHSPQEHFFRNADFDELYFIHAGSGTLETTYGPLEYKKGDYITIPRGTTYKFYPQNPNLFLRVESCSQFEEPDRGMLGPNALYDQTVIRAPKAKLGSEQNLSEYKVKIKKLSKITTVTYPFNPLDVKGWKGSLYPKALSIYDICPIMSHRYHIPPSGHTTFVAKNFVVCSFVERPLEDSKHKVLKVPFYHSNIDFDEVLFYHQGDFFSRDNIEVGALTFHPGGIHHGPHPNAFKNVDSKDYTDEYAVMIDCKNSLHRSKWFKENENKNYWKSWMAK